MTKLKVEQFTRILNKILALVMGGGVKEASLSGNVAIHVMKILWFALCMRLFLCNNVVQALDWCLYSEKVKS